MSTTTCVTLYILSQRFGFDYIHYMFKILQPFQVSFLYHRVDRAVLYISDTVENL